MTEAEIEALRALVEQIKANGTLATNDIYVLMRNAPSLLAAAEECEQARRTGNYWKMEKVAADAEIDRLRAENERLRAVLVAAKRVNELVGTETEDGQDAAWQALDTAIAAAEKP